MSIRREGETPDDRQLWAEQQQGSWEVGYDPARPGTDRTVSLDGIPIADYPPADVTLVDLLAFIRGEGRYAILGEGISTYPGRDANNERIYWACCELERRRLIRRHREEPGYVLFLPTRCECGACYKRASSVLVCERCTLATRQEDTAMAVLLDLSALDSVTPEQQQRARRIAQTELVAARQAAERSAADINWQLIPLLERDRLGIQVIEQGIARAYGVDAACLGAEASSASIDLSRHSLAEIEAVLNRVLPLEEER